MANTRINGQQVLDLTINTADIADGAVTLAKMNDWIGSASGQTTGSFTLNTTAGTYQDTGITRRLPAAGTYLVWADVRGLIQISAGVSAFVVFKLHNLSDAVDIANTETILCYTETTGKNVYDAASVAVIITVTAFKDINIYAKRDGTTPTFVSSNLSNDANGRTRLGYVRIY